MTVIRRVLFYFFSFLFIAGCPLMVLYALGYIMSPVHSGKIIRTGLVYLSTTPPAASVYLWKKRYHEKTPTILRDLLPGDYLLRLGLKRYRAWQRMIKVEAGKATVLDQVLLIPGVLTPLRLSEESFEKLIPVSGTRYLVLQKGSAAQDLFIFDMDQKKIAPVFTRRFYYKKDKVSRIFTVPSSPFLVVELKLNKGRRIYWVKLDEGKTRFKILDDLFAKSPETLKWDPKTARHLFAFQDHQVSHIDLLREKTEPAFFQQVRGLGVERNWVYALTENRMIRSDFQGEQQKVILGNTALFNELFGSRDFFNIHAFSDNVILFLSAKGKVVSNRLPYFFIDSEISGIERFSGSSQVLFWDDSRIGLMDFSDEARKNILFEQGPRVEWIYDKGDKIRQAFWVYGNSHVLFRDGNDLYLFELWLGPQGKVERLLSASKNTDVYYSEETGFLYYLNPENNRLFGIEICPKKQIPIFEFSELAVQKTFSPGTTQKEPA